MSCVRNGLQLAPIDSFDSLNADIDSFIDELFLDRAFSCYLHELCSYLCSTCVDSTAGGSFYSLYCNRINNFGEAYHTTLQAHFPRQRPAVSQWLVVTREMSCSIDANLEGLVANRRGAPARSAVMLNAGAQIANAKTRLTHALASFCQLPARLNALVKLGTLIGAGNYKH